MSFCNFSQFVRLRATLPYTHANPLHVTPSNYKPHQFIVQISPHHMSPSACIKSIGLICGLLATWSVLFSSCMLNTLIGAHTFIEEVECLGFEHLPLHKSYIVLNNWAKFIEIFSFNFYIWYECLNIDHLWLCL